MAGPTAPFVRTSDYRNPDGTTTLVQTAGDQRIRADKGLHSTHHGAPDAITSDHPDTRVLKQTEWRV